MRRLLLISLALFIASATSSGKSFSSRTVRIESGGRNMKMKVLQPKESTGNAPGFLWIHGGGLTVAVCLYVAAIGLDIR